MIIKNVDGKIYEIPEDRYAEFEVSPQRAAEIQKMLKSEFGIKNMEDVAGYSSIWDCTSSIQGTRGTKSTSMCVSTKDSNTVIYNNGKTWLYMQ